MSRNTRTLVLFLSIAAACAAGFLIPSVRHALGGSLGLLATGQLAQFQHHLRSLGPWAPITSMALLVASALFVSVPATVVMVANGLVFDFWTGALVSLIGSLLGAAAAYAIGRSLGRVAIARFVSESRMESAERMMARKGPLALVLMRWIPGMPGDLMGFAAGITRVSIPTFIVYSTMGMVPPCLIAAFVGANIDSDVPLRYWISGWVIVAIFIVVRWRWKAARRRASQS